MSNREYKSDVFSMLMEEPENALQVYNSLNNSNYTDPSLVEYVTLENGISLTVRNDAAFIVGTDISFYEHQSKYNENMPLRQLIYYSLTLEDLVDKRDLFTRKRIPIPTPHFVVFYNGTEDRPAFEIQRLSDSFQKAAEEPNLELKCLVYNINKGQDSDNLLGKCPVLKDYAEFISRVRSKEKEGKKNEDALNEAIDSCIRDGILADFLEHRRNEVTKSVMIDMRFEVRERLIRKEEHEEGLAEGLAKGGTLKLIKLVCRKLAKGKEAAEIATDLDENFDEINEICEVAQKFAPEYDAEKIFESLRLETVQ